MHSKVTLKDVSIVDFKALDVAILEHRGSVQTLPLSIQNFIAWRQKNKLSPNNSRTFNIVYDNPKVSAGSENKFGLAVEVLSKDYVLAEHMQYGQIPSGRCAYLRHIGPDHSMSTSIEFLFSEWLVATQNTLRDFPLFFERVRFSPEISELDMITDIYLPIT